MKSRADQASNLAAQWIIRQEEPGWSSDEQAALEAWLAESMLNRAAYLRQREGWRAADRIAALGSPATTSGPSLLSWKGWSIPAIAASLVVALMVGVMMQRSRAPDVATRAYATSIGAQKAVSLGDGSRIEMNTATRIRAAVADKRREIWLDEGEAYFDVARKAGSPFIVYAGNRTITVLGTKFSVRREAGKVTVSVAEGRVRIDDADDPKAVRSAIITAGDIAIARASSTLVAARANDKVENALAWREGMLSFDNMRLGEAVGEFNRYHRKQILIEDPDTADMRIDGAFQASNIDAFVRLLHDAYQLEINENADTVIISAQ